MGGTAPQQQDLHPTNAVDGDRRGPWCESTLTEEAGMAQQRRDLPTTTAVDADGRGAMV